jgi:hypothetical protein
VVLRPATRARMLPTSASLRLPFPPVIIAVLLSL